MTQRRSRRAYHGGADRRVSCWSARGPRWRARSPRADRRGDPDGQLRRGQRVSAPRHQPGRHGRHHVAGGRSWRGGEVGRPGRDGPDDREPRHLEQPAHGRRGSGRPRQVVVPVRFLRDVRCRRRRRAEGRCRLRGAHQPEQRVPEHDRAGVHGGRAGALGGSVCARGRGTARAAGRRPERRPLPRGWRPAHVRAARHGGGAGQGRPQPGGLLRRTARG